MAQTTNAATSNTRSDPITAPDESSTPTPHSESTPAKVPKSCTKAFDSLYYCYSPMFQARQYYMNGQLDSCRGRLRRFRLCLLSRLKPSSQAEQLFVEEEQRAKAEASLENVQPVWEMRDDYLANVKQAEEEEKDELVSPKEKTSWWL